MNKSKGKVLIVEDEIIVAKDIEISLTNRGFQVTSIVSTGQQAIKAAKKDRPDIILFDIMLKGKMDGIDAARKIGSFLQVPIIFISAYTNSEILERSREIEPYAFIVKPFNSSELLTNVEMALFKHRLDKNLKESEERLKIIFEYAPDTFYISDLKGVIIDGNLAAEQLTGYKREELIGSSLLKLNLVAAKEIPRAAYLLGLNALGKSTGPDEFTLLRKNRDLVIAEVCTYPVQIRGKKCVLGIARDITARKKIEQSLLDSENKYRNLVEQAGVAIMIDNEEGRIVYCNQRCGELFGYKEKELLSRQLTDIVHPDDITQVTTLHRNRFLGKMTPKNYEFKAVKKDGSTITVEVFPGSIEENNKIIGTRSYIWNITARKQAEQELRTLSMIDQLTGLYNRRGFDLLTRQQINLANRTKKGFYLFYIDIDRMKWINDNHGHHEGDRILIATAEICRQCFRKSDVISRIGGDEFAVTAIDANIDSKDIITKRIQSQLIKHNRTQDKNHQLSISIGATFYSPEEPMTFDELLACADKIMYESKSGKRIHELPAVSKEAPSIAGKKIKPGYFAKTDIVKLLIIGADQKENNLIAKTLDQTTTPTIAVELASKLEQGMKKLLDGGFSALLLNIGQSGNLGLSIIKTIYNTVPDIPIIIIVDEKTNNELMISLIREGAQDCLIKQKIEKGRFKRSILYAIERKHAELELKNNLHSFVHVLEGTIETMASIVETRDPYTAGHQRRVSMLAESIAHAMNLSEEQTKSVRLAALIHDVGKIKIPENILSKPNKLDNHEMELIKNHPVSGFEILKAIKFPWLISQIVYQHHERINGSGYPNGIGDKDLLIESKILAVADVVEAMSSDRPYRKAPGINKALQEIKEKSGELYDPAVVEACIRIFQSHSPPVLKT